MGGFGYMEDDYETFLDGGDCPGGHLRGGVPVVDADATAAVLLAALAAAVAHQLIDDPGWDAGVLEPGGEGVAEVVRAVQVDRIEQRMAGGRQRRPGALHPILAGAVDRRQASGAQLLQRDRTVA